MGFIKNKKFIIFLIILGVFCIGQVVFAKELAVGWPPSPFGTKLDEKSEIPAFIGYLYEWGISIGGLAVFIALLIAGFQYLSSIGNPATMREAKDRIISALLGLVLLLGSYLILNTINPQLTKLQLPPFEPGETLLITTKTITDTFDVNEMTKQTTELKPCKRAEISFPEGGRETIILDREECSFRYRSDVLSSKDKIIATDEIFTVKGYLEGVEDATSCMGYVVIYGGEKCSGKTNASCNLVSFCENIHVIEGSQSAQFFRIEI